MISSDNSNVIIWQNLALQRVLLVSYLYTCQILTLRYFWKCRYITDRRKTMPIATIKTLYIVSERVITHTETSTATFLKEYNF